MGLKCVEEYALKDGVSLTDSMFSGHAPRSCNILVSDFDSSNTYLLSDYLSSDMRGDGELPGIKLICDVGMLIDVSWDYNHNPNVNMTDTVLTYFQPQDGDYILYLAEYFVFLVRGDTAYQIGGGGGSEPMLDTAECMMDLNGIDYTEEFKNYAKKYPMMVA